MIKNQLLTAEWITRLAQFAKLIVGFSGGLDSTVLLHVLASYPVLRSKLLAVHINHGISPNASSWQKHGEQFCHNLGIEFISESVQFDRSANIEEHARDARYAVFTSLLTEQDCLVLGHHQDDQAETVLLHLFRGAGIDGLAAMAESGRLGKGELVRPLLDCPRSQLEHYAAVHGLNWIEDESNQDVTYSRNYLRQRIMPLLIEKWPAVAGNIARTATHSQQARLNLDALAVNDYPELLSAQNSLSIEPLLSLSDARITNILRVWLRNNHIQVPSTLTLQRLLHEMIFARTDAIPEVSWGEIVVRRYQQHLYLEKKNLLLPPSCIEWTSFPSPLILENFCIRLQAKKYNQGLVIPQDAKIIVRFRQGGETIFWHGQTKQLKKLFQEWEIPPWLRERIPLIYINEQLAAVVGYAVSDLFFKNHCSQSWKLEFSGNTVSG